MKRNVITALMMLLLVTPGLAGPVSIAYSGRNRFECRDKFSGQLEYLSREVLDGTNLTVTSYSEIATETTARQLWVGEYQRNGLGGTFYEISSTYMIWDTNGVVTSNRFEGSYANSAVFSTGGDQGIIAYDSDGKHYIQSAMATFMIIWNNAPTNCPLGDDMCRLVYLFRHGPVAYNWNWFVGLSAAVLPNNRILAGIQTPLNDYWNHMGADRCYGCGDCWLLTTWGLSNKVVTTTSLRQAPSPQGQVNLGFINYVDGSSAVELVWPAASGSSAEISRSSDLNEWAPLGRSTASGGYIRLVDTNPPPNAAFYITN